MKILSPYAYFAPEHAASSYLWENLHEDFAKVGIDCVVYTPIPTRGVSADIRAKYKKLKLEHLYDGKLTINRFSLYSESKNPLLRAIRYLISCFIQFGKCIFDKNARNCDVIFIASTPPILGLVGAYVSKLRGIPFVYNLQDIFPDSLVGSGLSKESSLYWRLGRKIENTIYRNADKIIVISEDFKKNIISKEVPEGKIEVVYNWVDEHAVLDTPRNENKLFDKYNLDRECFYITYSGNIGLTQNMDMLMAVADELKHVQPMIRFVIFGEGAYKVNVEKMIIEKKLQNVVLLPFQPYKDISQVFSLGDVGLVISKPGVGANSVPSKTWSIMSASRPIIANFDENELKTIITENKCGIFTNAGDKDSFIEAIFTLFNNRLVAQDMGRNGREFVLRNLTRAKGTRSYIEVIKSVVEH